MRSGELGPASNQRCLACTHAQELLSRRGAGMAVSVAEMKVAIEAAIEAGMGAESSKIFFDAGDNHV